MHGMQEVRSSILLISTIKNLITTRFMSRVVIFYYMKNRRRLALGLAIKKNDSNQQQELSFFYSFFKEKGPRMAAKVLCDGPFASDYVTGVGFW